MPRGWFGRLLLLALGVSVAKPVDYGERIQAIIA